VDSFEAETRKARDASKVWRNPTLALVEAPMPPLKPGEVLIRVKSCGVCGSDVHLAEAADDGYTTFSGSAKLPTTLGHEFAGEIVEVGSEVVDLKVGDLVTAESIQWCGKCASCRSGNPNQCQRLQMIGFGVPGAFAEFIAVEERFCWSLESLKARHDSVQEICDLGALIEPIGCAYNGMFVAGGGFMPGQSVAVYGAGPIGLGAIMLARLAGASQILALDVSDYRCRLASLLGADHVANPNVLGIEVSDWVLENTTGKGIDLQIEAAGAASETIPQIRKSFAENGKMVFLGRQDSTAPIDFNPIVSGANMMVGARGHAGHGVFDQVIRLIASGRLKPAEMITSAFEFDEVIPAIHQAAKLQDGKVMVHL
jgi:threonine dehydrogenase-like Zn-dependent dehydrogenase